MPDHVGETDWLAVCSHWRRRGAAHATAGASGPWRCACGPLVSESAARPGSGNRPPHRRRHWRRSFKLGRRPAAAFSAAGLCRSSARPAHFWPGVSGCRGSESCSVGGTVPAIGPGLGVHGRFASRWGSRVCPSQCSLQSAHRWLMNCPWRWVLQVVIECAPPSRARWRSPVPG